MYWIYERICLLSDRYPCPSGRDSQPQWLWDSRSFYNSNISFLLLSDSLQSFRKTIFLHPNWMLGVWWGGVSCFGHSPAAQDESAWLQVQLMLMLDFTSELPPGCRLFASFCWSGSGVLTAAENFNLWTPFQHEPFWKMTGLLQKAARTVRAAYWCHLRPETRSLFTTSAVYDRKRRLVF